MLRLAQPAEAAALELLGIYVISALLFGSLCAVIWSRKGGSRVAGFLLGLILGAVGLIFVVAARPAAKMEQENVELP